MKKMILILALTTTFNVNAVERCANGEQNCWDCSGSGICIARLKDGVLTVSGSGATRYYSDYHTDPVNANPWAGRDDIEKVVVEEGITHLGGNMFEDCASIKEVSLPQSLSYIAFEVFQRTSLESIVIPDNVEQMGSWMFTNSPVKGIVIGESLDTIEEWMGLPNDVVIFCNESEKRTKTCKELIEENNSGYETRIQPYEINENGDIIYKNKQYSSLADLAKGKYIPKRIYTIDEASAVAGKKNTFSIRYR